MCVVVILGALIISRIPTVAYSIGLTCLSFWAIRWWWTTVCTVTFTRSVQIFGPISIGILWEVRDVAVVAMVNVEWDHIRQRGDSSTGMR